MRTLLFAEFKNRNTQNWDISPSFLATGNFSPPCSAAHNNQLQPNRNKTMQKLFQNSAKQTWHIATKKKCTYLRREKSEALIYSLILLHQIHPKGNSTEVTGVTQGRNLAFCFMYSKSIALNGERQIAKEKIIE